MRSSSTRIYFFVLDSDMFLFLQWKPKELDEALLHLKHSAIKPGNTYIYPLWKSLLSRWLSNSDYEVYLVTPFLDVAKMTDICKIVLQNRATANIGAFYVRNECNTFDRYTIGEAIEKAKTKIKEELNVDCSTIIEDTITMKIVKQNFFTAKFIGCTHGEKAEVLVTSANFTGNHFDKHNLDFVEYQKMEKEEFHKRFIDPIKSLSVKLEKQN